MERRFGAEGLHATSVHPGGIFTNLARHLTPEMVQGMMMPGMEKALKSPEQGAATTVWAAIGKQWEGQGGKYLEDCSVSEPFQPREGIPLTPGYAPHAYDEAAAKQLWDVSVQLVGLQ